MERRSLLQFAGTGATGALAGCLGRLQSRSDDSVEDGEHEGSEREGPHRFVIESESEDPARQLPIELSYELVDTTIEPGDPARMSWTVRNTGAEAVTLESGPPWPFDVAFLLPEDDEDERVTMWTDAYEESEYLRTEGRAVRSWEPTFVSDRLGGGESFTETYDLAHDAPHLAAGTYEFWRLVRAKRNGADDTREGNDDHGGETNDTHKFEFTIAIESA